RTISGPDASPVDLLAVSRESVLKRLLPLVAVGALVMVLFAWRRSRTRQPPPSVRARLAASLPSVHDVAEHLPSVHDLAELPGRVPALHVGDVQAAIRRHRN